MRPVFAKELQQRVLRSWISGSKQPGRHFVKGRLVLEEDCLDALARAAPFPRMKGDVRCLAGLTLPVTFTIETKEAPH